MKIIFQDVDGVLNSTRFHSKQYHAKADTSWPMGHLDPDAIKVLNTIVDKTGAGLVVSSVWRIGQRVTWLREVLTAAGFKGQVLGTTPVFNNQPRGAEIQAWLDGVYRQSLERRLGPLTHFVILDDDTDMAHLYDKLVHIDYADGLTEAYVPTILKHLGCE